MNSRRRNRKTGDSNPYGTNEREQFDNEEAPTNSPFWLVLVMAILFFGWILVLLFTR